MKRIKVLTRDITEQIAAGEVVENPASVVKELVENSLDAGAAMVEVRITGSGLKEIRITDNGGGIMPGEASLAFQRHATSKITSADDLLNIRSLGFRGEALASISAVSKVTMITRSAGELGGTRIKIEGGQIILPEEETGAPEGTDIIISDLFYNTPARRAFLKSPAQEMKRITLLMTGLAFSNPGAAFFLWNDDKLVFKTRGDGNIHDIISEVYGSEASRSMTEIQPVTENSVTVSGYISTPLLTRSTRQYQTILVNRRLVRSNLISGAMKRGYQGLIQADRFPMAVLYLEVDPRTIDVNIHPAKSEVRFHNERDISAMVYKAVRNSLGRTSPSFPDTSKRRHPPETHDLSPQKEARTYSLQEGLKEDHKEEVFPAENKQLFPESDFRVIGQFLSTYIVAQKSGELVLIDQHAAHERILYEKYLKAYSGAGVKSVLLAAPLTVEVSYAIDAEVMAEAGFNIETFGYNTYIVRAIPDYLSDTFNREFFMDLIEKMKPEELAEDKKEEIIKMASCKGAVKANSKLGQQEIISLVSEWEQTENPLYCPHGRPAVISYSRHEIERGFRRKGGK